MSLRAEKTIRVGGEGGEEVTVLELTVDQMTEAFDVLEALVPDKDRKGASKSSMAMARVLLVERREAVLRLLCGASSLGEGIRAVGGLALLELLDAWMEVNAPFFARLGERADRMPRTVPGPGTEKRQSA